jgi:hypothetical protein
MNSRSTIFIVLAAAALAPAAAQNVYRCGDSYSQTPCAGGAVVNSDDPRSASQRAQTTQAAQRDARAADAMEKARLKEEAKPASGYIPSAKVEPPAAEKKPEQAGKPKKPAYFTATAPGKPGDAAAKKKKPKKKDA